MESITGAIIGGLIAWVISIPIFGMRGGRPGGCLKSLANLAFIAIGALIGAALAGGLG